MNGASPTCPPMPAGLSGGFAHPSSYQYYGSQLDPAPPKAVTFQLLMRNVGRARLELRVHIHPHDTTDSIVSTVKNFFGIYANSKRSVGVSFEDHLGNVLIARYENFTDSMVVYVRAVEEPLVELPSASPYPTWFAEADGRARAELERLPRQPTTTQAESTSPRRRSQSPATRRSASASTSNKAKSRSAKNGDGPCDGYSSGDNASSSTTTTTTTSTSTTLNRPKDPIPNTEISVENIVEGGRRKRAKFESSELPLFAPLQMPATTSNPSGSPVRRYGHFHRHSPSFVPPHHNPLVNPQPLVSPQGYGAVLATTFATPDPDSRRPRGSISYPNANGVLPTPDPTVGSCVSDEDKDVAMQLMRLGETSAISTRERISVSIMDRFGEGDDTASSTGITSDGARDSEDDERPVRRQKLEDGAARAVYPTTDNHFAPYDPNSPLAGRPLVGAGGARPSKPKLAQLKTALPISKPKAPKVKSSRPTGVAKIKKQSISSNGPMSPPSVPSSRKQSVASATMASGSHDGDDVVDLSSKPRCQRCRKSKKGCDRQRPCGRCKDAGLTAAECISEDEGNGRKGRYGRHMGVPLKKDDAISAGDDQVLQPVHVALQTPMISGGLGIMSPETTAADKDKNKKRKR